ncbi:MAG: YciI family protein [Solirubrobacteraceae bacterium]
MPQYAILIYTDESTFADAGAIKQVLKDHGEFIERNGPVLRGGSGLLPVETATSIRRESGGAFSVTDGAFVETKEALGGYYMIEVADLDEAIAVAKQVPAPAGGVEVRPVRPGAVMED